MRRPVVVQHSFGEPGSGGPIGALERVLASHLTDRYEFVRMHQDEAVGGINTALLKEWVQQLRSIRPDIVHVRGLGNEGFHGALAARLAGCPRVLVSIHGSVRDLTHAPRSARRSALVHLLEPATLRMATHLATVCHSAAARPFLDPYRRKLVGVITNGVTLPTRSEGRRQETRLVLSLAPDETVFVVVGRLTVEKGHVVLAKALQHLGADAARVTLVLVGDGPDRAQITAGYGQVAGLRLHMLGRRSDVSDILAAADVFLFPTLHENLSNALLEGMAASLPVIATAVGGNVEVLQQGGGILVPPSDALSLSLAVAELLDRPDLRSLHGSRARRVVEEGYTVEHMIERLGDRYRSMLDHGSGV